MAPVSVGSPHIHGNIFLVFSGISIFGVDLYRGTKGHGKVYQLLTGSLGGSRNTGKYRIFGVKIGVPGNNAYPAKNTRNRQKILPEDRR